jgi:hypothetical protein
MPAWDEQRERRSRLLLRDETGSLRREVQPAAHHCLGRRAAVALQRALVPIGRLASELDASLALARIECRLRGVVSVEVV